MIKHDYTISVAARITLTVRTSDQVEAMALMRKTLSSSILKYGFTLDSGVFDPEYRLHLKEPAKLYCVQPYKINVHIK